MITPPMEGDDGTFAGFPIFENLLTDPVPPAAAAPPVAVPPLGAADRIRELEAMVAALEAEKKATQERHAAEVLAIVTETVRNPGELLRECGPFIQYRDILRGVPCDAYTRAFDADVFGGTNVAESIDMVPGEAAKVMTSWVELLRHSTKYGTEYIDHIAGSTPHDTLIQALSEIPYLYLEAFEILHHVADEALPPESMPRFTPGGGQSVGAYMKAVVDVITSVLRASKKVAPRAPRAPTAVKKKKKAAAAPATPPRAKPVRSMPITPPRAEKKARWSPTPKRKLVAVPVVSVGMQ